MSALGFQKRVLYLLTDVTNQLGLLGKQYEPAESPFRVERMTTLDDFVAFDDMLNGDEDKQRILVSMSMLTKSVAYTAVFLLLLIL